MATVLALDQTDPTPANDQAEADVEVLAHHVEIVGPVTDDEALAYTGWNFGFAVSHAAVLLLCRLALLLARPAPRAPNAPADGCAARRGG